MKDPHNDRASGSSLKGMLKVSLLAAAVLALALVGLNVAAGAFGGHGRAGIHQSAARLLAKLDLREDQQVYVESLHETLMGLRHAHREHGPEHLHRVLQRITEGTFEVAEGRAMVDQHIDQLRHAAYQISDDIAGLSNSLDDQQRAQLVEHLETLHEAHRLLLGLDEDGSGSKKRHGHGSHGGHDSHH